MNLEALDHVGLAVSDVDRSIEWYQRVLGPDAHLIEVTTYEVAETN